MKTSRLALAVSLFAPIVWGAPPAPTAEQMEFFETNIRPALQEHCADCHSGTAGKVKGGLDLDTRSGWEKGGETGPAIVPGDPESSLLITAVRRMDKDLAMPPKKELPRSVVEHFITWVKMGAPDPRVATTASAPAAPASERPAFDLAEARKQWAFRPPERSTVPAVKLTAWPQNEVDRFLLAAMEGRGLAPSPAASPEVLLRRLTYDLIGLPPSSQEIQAFVEQAKINRPQAVTGAVERLLRSPHYGEKWGRHWLDVVRYADSLDARGQGKEGDILDAWRYRDWVVQSFNNDLPYDEFIRQQVAGDILAARDGWDANKVVATGMYAIGNWGNGDSDKLKVHTDIVDDQIDVTTRAFMGLTLACARCHDHKFDPLSTADYYAMAGFFFSSHILDKFAHPTAGEKIMRIPLLSPQQQGRRVELQQRLAVVDAELNQGLLPFDSQEAPVKGAVDVVSLNRKGASNPSLLVNRSGREARFSTITLPPGAVSVHPGPKSAVTLAWRAPEDLTVNLHATLTDADAHCGDGIEWVARIGERDLSRGTLANGATAKFEATEVSLTKGSLLALTILRGREYTCDTTAVNLRLTSKDGRTWDLSRDFATSSTIATGQGWLVCEGEGTQLVSERASDSPLVKEQQALQAELAATDTAMCHGLREGGIPGTKYEGFHDAQIHVRGSYARLAALQRRGFPALLSNAQPSAPQGSGRLDLARWIASPDHPLTARVMVNRIWQHHLGRGIVATANNFGKLGTPPTHPELLDWLAHRFMDSGWSIKAMHRLICTSAAYQQTSIPDEEVLRLDPDNAFFTRQHRMKLSAEELRDTLLLAGGNLDRTVGGISVKELQIPRRTLYLTAVRSDRSSFRMLFDGADPNTVVEARNDSVVAPQALWLLNHPFALEQAAKLAQRLPAEAKQTPAQGVTWLYRELFSRSPSPAELQLAVQLIGGDQTAPASWETLCHALMCSNEFLFVD
ncbi:PSD1 and planctomycete cytochrome C domain-containing protein [Verrucomicrobium sp. BvORR106]|uniref:PSD1 and planctomycete cytochrome C domain-containing protein n=1 Tax=Verrucomicrobium sp. BvORR106 TaxID=1403819 RepID=UPI00068C0458|nr:PSD1 and planctomycete cytochrome C domain-containing protein [Verrucomicrobium sp. BvORR106]